LNIIRFTSSIAAGLGSIKHLNEALESQGIPRKVAIVCGESTYSVAGKDAYDVLNSTGFDVLLLLRNFRATLKDAETLVEELKGKGIQAVIGVGGGKIIDISKYAAYKLGIPLVSVPTTLSSDAIATGYSVLWQGERNQAVQTSFPALVVGDYDVLSRQPSRFIAAGIGDMLSKITALPDWRLGFWLGGEKYNDFAAKLAAYEVELLISRLNDVVKRNYIGIESLFLAEVFDGYLMQIAGTTRVAAGSEHLFCFALEQLTDRGLHGEYCGLGSIIMEYLQVGERGRVRQLLEKGGAPTSASELGIDKSIVIRALTMAHKMRDWYTVLGTPGLSDATAERLARYARIV